MAGDLDALERRVSELIDRLRKGRREVLSAELSLRDIDESIAACKERIGELKRERRGQRGMDRDTRTSMIEDEYILKSDLYSQRNQAKAALGEALRECKQAQSKAASDLKVIVDQVTRHVGNLQRLGNTSLPADAFGAGARLQSVNLHAAQRLHQQVSTLSNELKGGGGSDEVQEELTYVPMADFKAWSDAIPTQDGKPSLIHPIDSGRSFYDLGDGRQIPVDDHDITDTIRPAGSTPQDKEAFGIAYAREYLRTQGHVLIEEVGGRDAPDILSVGMGKGARLVVTEVKGTATGARIDQMNLTATLADGAERHENERGYLRKTGNRVLLRLGREIEACTDPQRRQDLMAIRSELGRVSRRGFIPGEYETQVIQVGWVDPSAPKAKELRPATLIDGTRWRDYLKAAQPDRIVQINVHAGSERVRISETAQGGIGVRGPSDSLDSGADTSNGRHQGRAVPNSAASSAPSPSASSAGQVSGALPAPEGSGTASSIRS